RCGFSGFALSATWRNSSRLGRGWSSRVTGTIVDGPKSILRSYRVAQRTFSIIKPDAVNKGYAGAILAEIEKAGFKLVSIRKQTISKQQAQGFYHVHAARPFFNDLCEFMSSGPAFLMLLEKDN